MNAHFCTARVRADTLTPVCAIAVCIPYFADARMGDVVWPSIAGALSRIRLVRLVARGGGANAEP